MDKQEIATEFLAVLKATDREKPSTAELARLRQYLENFPELAAFTGDLAAAALSQVLNHAMPERTGSRICAEAFVTQLRDDLGYEDASTVERSLIQHLCLCWLRLYTVELRYEAQEILTVSEVEFWEKKLSANQRRYLRAIETLARVRKLMKDPPSPALAILLKQQMSFHK